MDLESAPTSGFLLVNKPKGLTSFRLLGPIKKLAKPDKVGHAGTLDQDAHGLMVVAVGRASRLIHFAEAESKTYEFTLHLGRETVSAEFNHPEVLKEDFSQEISLNDLSKILPNFIGCINQTPPKYSAVKIEGKRASDRVRAGEEVKLKSREIEIFNLTCIDTAALSAPNQPRSQFRLRCHCSKGTYIRSLCVDIAQSFEMYGAASDIYRTQIGEWKIDDAIELETIRESCGLSESSDIELEEGKIVFKNLLISPNEFLEQWPTFQVKSKVAFRLSQGLKQVIDCDTESEYVFLMNGSNELICFAQRTDDHQWQPKVVFQ